MKGARADAANVRNDAESARTADEQRAARGEESAVFVRSPFADIALSDDSEHAIRIVQLDHHLARPQYRSRNPFVRPAAIQ